MTDRYCVACGRLMEDYKHDAGYYHPDTGEKVYRWQKRCPKYRWWWPTHGLEFSPVPPPPPKDRG